MLNDGKQNSLPMTGSDWRNVLRNKSTGSPASTVGTPDENSSESVDYKRSHNLLATSESSQNKKEKTEDIDESAADSILKEPTTPRSPTASVPSEEQYLSPTESMKPSDYLRQIHYSRVIKDENFVRRYTGFSTIRSYLDFMVMLKEMEYDRCWQKKVLDFDNGILLCLMKLRQNFFHYHLGFLFGIRDGVASDIFKYGVGILMNFFESYPYNPLNVLNQSFLKSNISFHLSDYPNCALIIDVVTFNIKSPTPKTAKNGPFMTIEEQGKLKALIAVTSSDHICYVSPCHTGNVTEKELVELYAKSLFARLWPGASVMGDQSLNIEEYLPKNIDYLPPPITMKKTTTTSTGEVSELITKLPLVDRLVRRARCFNILSDEVGVYTVPMFSDISRCGFYLTNFWDPTANSV
eukprot:Awhi_evm1s12462